MEKKEKLDMLRKLNESRLRKEVLVPLFEKMGFKDVIEYHGSVEKGKDIIFYEMDKFDNKIYTGVVVKAGDITGSASSSSGAMNVLNQIQQTLNEPYTDIYGLKELKIDRCIVITTGEITPQSIESIKGSLKGFNLDKLLSFFDGNKIVDLLEKHMPDYFFNEIECYTRYFNKMKEDFESIRDIAAIGQKEPVPLETIYVSLKLSQEIRRPDFPLDKDQTESRIYDDKKKQQMERKLERAEPRDRVMDVDSAVKSFSRMVILGAPGAGKTTLLKHLALKYCKENIDQLERVTVPIPVTLRESIQSGKDLREYIDDVFEKYCFKEAKEFVEKELQNGKCMLLLDGFDELVTRESQAKAAEQIHGFIQKYPLCRFIVTSRIAWYHDELSRFTRLELMDFDEKQMKEFIDHWFGQGEPKKAASMWNAVKANENIGKLARNPLLMTIISIIYEEDHELPQGRAALYERSVDVLLSRWDKAKKLKNKFSPENKVFMLRKLAYESHCLNRRALSHLDIMGIIDQYASRIGLTKEEYESFLAEIWERSYLLRQIAVDSYDFLHLSFQEYFTALELREQPDGIGTIIKHIDEPWWEEPMLLYAGISRDATELIRRIQKEVPEDMFYSNLMLAGKCIADAPFTESKLKDKIIQSLWNFYQEGKFELLRNISMEVLSRIKPRQIIDRLILKLKNKKSKVRYESARILREMRIVEAVPHLVQVFENDKSENVRSIAALALGELGSTDAIPHLIRALENNKDGDVRRSAALTLGEIGSAEYVPQIIRALENDKDKNVRCSAAEALGKIGSAETVPHLIQALTNDKSSDVRWNAVTAFGYIGSAEAVPHIIEALKNDKNEIVRWGAADTLGYMGSADAVPHLIQVLTKDRDNLVRIFTAEALGNIGSAEAVPQLIQMLENDTNEDVRSSGADALGAIGSVDAIPHLIRVLTKDRDNLVRSSAVDALREIGSVDTVPHLIQVLENDKAEDVRNSAALALGEIRSSDAVPQLIQALRNDKDKNVRRSTAFALGIIGSAEAVPHLIRALENDKDEDVRSSAAEILGEIGDESVIPYLKELLKDDTEEYRFKVKDAAYEALEKISKRLQKRIFSGESN